MTETTPRGESSPAGRLIPDVEKFKSHNRKVAEAARLDSISYGEGDLGGGRPASVQATTASSPKKGWSP